MEREITLAEILEARDRRAQRQRELLARWGGPLISFTMNIPGPVKDTPLIRRGFATGCRMLYEALEAGGMPVLCRHEEKEATGCQLYCAVRADAAAVKALCTRIEDASPLGRLFDMDVLDGDGQKLDRETVGGGARNCIVCGAPGRGCASRRVHSVPELQAATRQILASFFAAADRADLADLATRALTDEVLTTPKPGLVDRANCGSHRDMDVSTFRASIEALAPYWETCVRLGQETAGDAPAETFARLRPAGREAEAAMLRATGGVNTHKGAIFTLGTLCGAAGRLWRPEAPCRDTQRLLQECAAMTAEAVEADRAALAGIPEERMTAGERLYKRFGLPGIRGEAAAGLPAVRETSLPALEAALAAGRSRNDAGAIALLHLIARGGDTNMAARGGPTLAAEAAERVRALLAAKPLPDTADIEALDRWFIDRNLSPGGCADLLAVTYFLHDLLCGNEA